MDSKTVLAMQICHINKNRHIINISKNNLFLMLVRRFRLSRWACTFIVITMSAAKKQSYNLRCERLPRHTSSQWRVSSNVVVIVISSSSRWAQRRSNLTIYVVKRLRRRTSSQWRVSSNITMGAAKKQSYDSALWKTAASYSSIWRTSINDIIIGPVFVIAKRRYEAVAILL